MDRGAWWATVLGVSKSQTRLSDLTTTKHLLKCLSSDRKTCKTAANTRGHQKGRVTEHPRRL